MKKFGFMVIVLALICVVGLVALSTDAHAEELASGTCGENVTWELDDSGTLVISGTGAMYDFDYATAPWYNWNDYINHIRIGEGVTSVGDFAFYNCYQVTSVELPNGLTRIGESAFELCDNLCDILIPDSVSKIESAAFLWCCSLTSINIPSGITVIEDMVFQWCTGLTEVNIPDSVSVIGYQSFMGCSGLVSVTIPKSVTEIKQNAFVGCENLMCITLSEGVVRIGDRAFQFCDKIWHVLYTGTEQEWNEIAIGVDNECFTYATRHYECMGNEVIDHDNMVCSLCANVAYIGSGICGENLTWVLTEDGLLSISGVGDMYDFSSPGSSGDCAPWYEYKDHIMEVIIGNGVSSIGMSSFCELEYLISVAVPDGVTSIGFGAFYHCSSLEKINIPDSVTNMDDAVFTGCTALKDINISDEANFCFIDGVLYNNPISKIIWVSNAIPENLVIADGVLSIGWGAFSYCSGLSSVTIPCSATSIDIAAFEGCTNLKSVTVLGNITNIGDWAFGDCRSLISFTVPSAVTTIGDYAFYGCKQLWHVLYEGSEEQWSKICIGQHNTDLIKVTRHYYCTGSEIIDLENKVCSICNPPCEHRWEEATCVSPCTCSLCGETEGKPKGHNYTGTVMSPTCTEKGYTTHTCANCGDTYVDTYMDALGHDWDEGVVTQEPTETSTGKKLFTCNACGETMVESIPELNHTHSYTETVIQPTCTERGYTTHSCACGDEYTDNYVDAVGHQYNSDSVCTICGQKDPSTGESTPTEPAPTESTNMQPSTEPSETNPAGNGTQDDGNNSFVLIAVLFAVGGIGIGVGIGLIALKKK